MRMTSIATFVVAVTLLAACGDDDETAETVADATAGTTADTIADPTIAPPASGVGTVGSTDTASGDAPAAIVSLSPTATEMLFAIGAGDQVIAVDSLSTYPAETADVVTDLSAFEPNVEAIAGYEPDLVVTSDDQVTDQLEGLGIDVWVGAAAATFDDAYAQLEQLGALTGHIAEAAEVVAAMQADLAEIAAAAPQPEVPLSVYHELDNTYYSANSATFIGQVYSLLGLQNIADTAEGDTGGYPQLNAEAIISADPEIIFLADGSFGESPETVAARDGWADIAAVRNGNIVVVDEDIASRWGPRVVDYARTVSEAMTAAVAAPAGG